MLLAMLNCCTKEELEESSDEETTAPAIVSEEFSERKKIIRNKILAVGRMSRVFALLRYVHFHPLVVLDADHMSCCSEESEKVSELKSVSGSGKLPYGTLASGADGIKEAISGFEDA